MLITKDLRLAASMLKTLKQKSGVSKVEDIAEEIGASYHFLEQISRKLRMNKLIKVIRGPGGGVVISEEGKNANFYDLAKALGRDWYSLENSSSSVDKLNNAIREAFLNTTI
jgi:DNA-binding IscR family transcriptional regulator